MIAMLSGRGFTKKIGIERSRQRHSIPAINMMTNPMIIQIVPGIEIFRMRTVSPAIKIAMPKRIVARIRRL